MKTKRSEVSAEENETLKVLNVAKNASIVLPCFNEELNIKILYDRICNVINTITNYNFELIFIDNCSTDGTVAEIEKLASIDKRVKAIINLNNFGTVRSPAHALLQTSGDFAIMMSTDLQDPPELIPEFIDKYEEGYNVVAGVKPTSDEKGLMWILRRGYYKIIKAISTFPQIENFTGFGLYDNKVITTIRNLQDNYPYLRGLVSELGFNIAKVEFHQQLRKHGKSNQRNFFVLYDFAMLGITTQSKIPLRFLTVTGFILSIISFVISIVFLILKLVLWYDFPMGMAPILCGMFFFSSVQLLFIGLLGEYILLIYSKVANRPLVIENRRINF